MKKNVYFQKNIPKIGIILAMNLLTFIILLCSINFCYMWVTILFILLQMILVILLVIIVISGKVSIGYEGLQIKHGKDRGIYSWNDIKDINFTIYWGKTTIYKFEIILEDKYIIFYNNHYVLYLLATYCTSGDLKNTLQREL